MGRRNIFTADIPRVPCCHAIKAGPQMMKLDLADNKTEAVLITNRTKNNTVKIWVGNYEVALKSIIRYFHFSSKQ